MNSMALDITSHVKINANIDTDIMIITFNILYRNININIDIIIINDSLVNHLEAFIFITIHEEECI